MSKDKKEQKCSHNYKKVGETSEYVYGWGNNIDYHYLCNKCGHTFSKRVKCCN